MFRIGKEEADAVTRVIMSGSMFRSGSQYSEVEKFEKEFREKMGVNHCLCMTNGTSAIATGLASLGVGPGDEVIVPGYTFIATATAVLMVGAIPVIADIDETLTIDVDDVERKLSAKTKAVIPVHMQGIPCNMGRLTELTKKHGFYIVEDTCQADGGSYKGKRLGTIGDCGAYSFNQFKIISAGEGGAFVTNDIKLFERAIIYHDCGCPFWPYETPISERLFSGGNMRISEITGAIMRVQLGRLDGILTDLRRVRKTIADAVQNISGIKINPSNDTDGDCGVCLPFIFDDVETAIKFEENLPGSHRPINTGKHVYSWWTPVLEKRGGHSDNANPYNNTNNRGLNMEFKENSCPKTLDILSRTVYMMLHCDWDKKVIDEQINNIKNAAKSL